jgi:UDP-N-acetylmuramate dehydrogenase
MLLDTADDNRRSAGSFFTNPILSGEEAGQLAARAAKLGLIRSRLDLPCYAQPDGRVKLAAAWLIERAGIAKGLRMGNVGISSKHALALVHHGGGTTAELLRLAIHVRDTVRERFGVTLVPEPIFLGLTWLD